ncbi:hypothetical protein UFOVP457_25 [uncultured Caudovirales phage]|uniref:Uncharacterized protein n=1 Tax=uncultured Caudovirales phage TaxID=2100421 RepID=A0A6J5MAN5_9CAUD|nr:hypothetical protein UFOVP457_25 [uncultured Caudovirales phage]
MADKSYQISGSTRPFPAIEGTDGNYYPIVLKGAVDSLGNVVSSSEGEDVIKYGFAKVRASGVDPDLGTVIITGSGQTVSQSAGNLVLAAGTTINAETIVRLNGIVSSEFTAQINSLLSQRVANNNFFFELVDVIDDDLAITIVNATTVTVTIPNNPFTTQNIGQSMYLGAYSGTGVFVPGRYAISAVTGNVVTFTVAGFTAGVGTCSAFGWNYHQLRYAGTTVTSADYDTQRNGWNTGFTAATINTTASPGHIAYLTSEQSGAIFADALAASSGLTNAITQRASRNNNVPFGQANLRLQIRMVNGTTAPTATTWTINLVELRKRISQSVSIKEIDLVNSRQALPVVLNNNSNIGTVTTVTGVTTSNGRNIPNTLVADVASAAITTTANTSAITPASGNCYEVNIPVTAVTGTTPTMDVNIEESDDSGTNWFVVYSFPRITAAGIYRSPQLPLKGNRIRYVQTIGGTTPSFTRAINRLEGNAGYIETFNQLFDRSIVLTTSNSVTPSLNISNARTVQLVINIGAATTAPVLQLEGSDDNGVTWYSIGSVVNAAASTTVAGPLVNTQAGLLRGRISTAGVGVTAGYVLIKGFKA